LKKLFTDTRLYVIITINYLFKSEKDDVFAQKTIFGPIKINFYSGKGENYEKKPIFSADGVLAFVVHPHGADGRRRKS